MNPIKHLVVVGVGLIGGSLSLALKRAGMVQRVTGVGRSRENLELACELGVIDDWTHDVAEAVRDADMVLLAVPMTAYDGLFKAMADVLPTHAIVTDAGSTKKSAIFAAQKHLANPARFVAAHPIAGTEHSGAAAAFAELFEDHLCILTPDEHTDAEALAAVKSMWESAGCTIREMGAAEHDDALAGVSHLPHLAAFALVNAVRKQAGADPFEFAAGGFRDFTRIASSSPAMWRDIALCNQQALIGKIDALQSELTVLREALQAGDGERLLNEFEAARQARDAWVTGDEVNIGGTLIAGPARGPLKGNIIVPGDKSMSHRAVMLASLADGVTEIHGFLPGEDNLATAQMFIDMGVNIEWLNDAKTALRVSGVGLHGLKKPDAVLDAGNAGTCVRLMTGVLAGQTFETTINGDASLQKRPMQRVVEPVRRMGATVEGKDGGSLLPLTISGGKLKAIHHVSGVASAQVKSCVLLAGLYADGETRVNEPKPTRDHTERMLPLFGQPVEVDQNDTIVLMPTGKLTVPVEVVDIPADPSSACFFAVAASLVEGSELCIRSIGVNPRRDGWRRVMLDMGADIELSDERSVGREPVADIVIRAGDLHGFDVDIDDVPDAIDEFPVLFVAAALAAGEFVLKDAEELRVKESDRIAAMAAALRSVGVEIEESFDGARIQGASHLQGGVDIDAHGDHRIAMAMAVAAQRAEGEIRIHNAAAIATSFPDFVSLAQSIGMNVRWQAG